MRRGGKHCGRGGGLRRGGADLELLLRVERTAQGAAQGFPADAGFGQGSAQACRCDAEAGGCA